jgi:chromosome segregation ATPase
MSPEPRLWDYVKAAFLARRRVRGLGGMPFNVLFVLGAGVAGLVNPGLWLIGAGLEVGYLTWLSHNQRFRNLVRGQRLQERALGFTQRLAATVASLSEESRARWRGLEEKCREIIELSATVMPLPAIEETKETGLNSLLVIHAKLLLSRELVRAYMTEGKRRELEQRLADTERRLAETTSEAIKRSLDSNVAILKKRIEHAANARENLQVIDAELERIENQVDLIREEVAVNRDPTVLSARIDAVASSLGEADRFLRANEALLGALGAEDTAPLPATLAPAARVGEGR